MKDSFKIQAFITYLKATKKIRSQNDLAEILGYKQKSSMSRVIKEPNDIFMRKIEEAFPDFKDFNPERANVKTKDYSSFTEIKIVTTKARAGYMDSFYSDEYLKDMPTVLMETDKEYKGNYLAFEVENDSMEPEYYEGDILICREVKRDLWNSKLHIKDYDFVIAHGTKGIFFKEISFHNPESGEIICHSLNPFYDDFTLNLREVAYIYNVVEVRQQGKRKRNRR